MRLLHDLAKIHVTFDDPNLVSRAGLVPVMALAQRAGLGELAGEHVRIGHRCGPLAGLSLGKANRRGHDALYDAVNCGEIAAGQLQGAGWAAVTACR